MEPAGQARRADLDALAEEDVFVADAGRWSFGITTRPAKLLGQIGRRDPPGHLRIRLSEPLLRRGRGARRTVAVANPGMHHIEAYTFDGHHEFSWGKAGMGDQAILRLLRPVEYRHPARRPSRHGRKRHSPREGLQPDGQVRVRRGRAGDARAEPYGR